jgi:hypothetical protein
MFPDAFAPNLAVFLLGQVVAWSYLRTGLLLRGVAVLILTWVFADLALVLRFAYGETGPAYLASLAAMQCVTLAAGLQLAIGRRRRRGEGFRRRRELGFRESMVQLLRDELDPARIGLSRLVRADPWDLPARLTLGVVLSRQGRARAARRQLVGARRLDRERRYADAIDCELRRLAGAVPQPGQR